MNAPNGREASDRGGASDSVCSLPVPHECQQWASQPEWCPFTRQRSTPREARRDETSAVEAYGEQACSEGSELYGEETAIRSLLDCWAGIPYWRLHQQVVATEPALRLQTTIFPDTKSDCATSPHLICPLVLLHAGALIGLTSMNGHTRARPAASTSLQTVTLAPQ